MNSIKTRKLLKIIIFFIFTILLISLITLILSCERTSQSSTASETTAQSGASAPTAEESMSNETNDIDQIKTVVESFGKVLVNVSLLSPPDILEKDMKKYYGPFLSEELISKWLTNPSEALGRLTSSPWPDHIEIIEVKKLTNDKYEVSGNVVEITSVEVSKGGYADKYGVSLTIEKIDSNWLITGVTKDLQASNS